MLRETPKERHRVWVVYPLKLPNAFTYKGKVILLNTFPTKVRQKPLKICKFYIFSITGATGIHRGTLIDMCWS